MKPAAKSASRCSRNRWTSGERTFLFLATLFWAASAVLTGSPSSGGSILTGCGSAQSREGGSCVGTRVDQSIGQVHDEVDDQHDGRGQGHHAEDDRHVPGQDALDGARAKSLDPERSEEHTS